MGERGPRGGAAALRFYLAAVYVALWAVALTAPATPAGPLLGALFTFQGPDPWSVAIFNLLGVWPVLWAGPLLADGPGRVPAWPFVALSFVAGAFILTPYLFLRRWGQRPPPPGAWTRAAGHPAVAAGLAVASVGLVGYAATGGALDVFAERLSANGFVRTFSADFVAMCLLYPAVALDDRRRLGLPAPAWPVFVPLLGGAWHTWRRGRAAG